MASVFYHNAKTLIDFWYRQNSNSSFLSNDETLPIELTKNHICCD
jgi:hypothetical protein